MERCGTWVSELVFTEVGLNSEHCEPGVNILPERRECLGGRGGDSRG